MMKANLLFSLACGGAALSCFAAADVTLPAVMYRSNAVYSLYEAATANAPEVIAARLSEGAAVNMPDELGNTPLHLAAKDNHLDIVHLLLNGGADPLLKDAAGKTPADLTTDESCRMLLARAEAVRRMELALGESILAHDAEAVRAAMRARINPSAFAADGESSMLMLAVRENQPEIVAALLEAGADAKAVSPQRSLGVLHAAVQSRHAELIPALLAAGADPLHMADNGATALHDAVWNGDAAAVAALLPAYKACNMTPPDSGQPAPIVMAITHERPELVRMMIEAGYDPNAVPAGKRRPDGTALHAAAKAGNAEAVRLLLEAGADKAARDRDGQTPAEVASPEIAEMLR